MIDLTRLCRFSWCRRRFITRTIQPNRTRSLHRPHRRLGHLYTPSIKDNHVDSCRPSPLYVRTFGAIGQCLMGRDARDARDAVGLSDCFLLQRVTVPGGPDRCQGQGPRCKISNQNNNGGRGWATLRELAEDSAGRVTADPHPLDKPTPAALGRPTFVNPSIRLLEGFDESIPAPPRLILRTLRMIHTLLRLASRPLL
jgi:hypothetical protein